MHFLFFLTQPNAYNDKYIIKDKMFMYSKYKGKRVSIPDTGKLLELLNTQVMNFCVEKKLTCIDMKSEIDNYNYNRVFLDEMHMTPYGAKIFAEIINSKIE